MTEPYLTTYTGRTFHPFNPRIEDIDIADIAHSLSNICRFGGHSNRFYSVAQHCYYVSYHVHHAHKLAGLLHDASEAYIGDIVHNVKYTLFLQDLLTPLVEAEEVILGLIFKKFKVGSVPKTTKEHITDVETSLLAAECREFGINTEGWHLPFKPPYHFKPIPWPPEMAKAQFMDRFNELTATS